MKEVIEKVKEFNNSFRITYAEEATIPDLNICILRHKLMKEENGEYIVACGDKDLVGIADALGDMLYILVGTMLTHGLHDKIEDVFNEIHRSNMSKLDENGQPICRADGKILKGDNYSPPELVNLIFDFENKKDM